MIEANKMMAKHPLVHPGERVGWDQVVCLAEFDEQS